MVKNTGGNKCKRQGRKYIHAPQQRSVRFIKEEGEMYAVVTKLYGGCNCEVICMDGNKRLCVIRNKFRGRDKGDNTISPKVWVLVGVREWESRQGKPQKCDLLEIYTHQERSKLIQECKQNLSVLLNHERSNEAGGGGNNEDEQGIVFSTIDDVEGGGGGGDEACAMENDTGGGYAINTDEAGNGGSHMDDEIDFDEI